MRDPCPGAHPACRGRPLTLPSQKWRIRVSIPVPRRCERRTLPIELIPHDMTSTAQKVTGVGFEPTPPERLVPKTSALDHSAIQPFTGYFLAPKDAPAGARTLGHRLIRPKRCQLRHKSPYCNK